MQTIAYSGFCMNQEAYVQLAARLQALAHPVRLRILDELRSQEACVCHLQIALQRSQVYTSQQLRVLRQAGIVSARQDGQNVFYQLCDGQTRQLLAELLGPEAPSSSQPGCSCPKCQVMLRYNPDPD